MQYVVFRFLITVEKGDTCFSLRVTMCPRKPNDSRLVSKISFYVVNMPCCHCMPCHHCMSTLQVTLLIYARSRLHATSFDHVFISCMTCHCYLTCHVLSCYQYTTRLFAYYVKLFLSMSVVATLRYLPCHRATITSYQATSSRSACNHLTYRVTVIMLLSLSCYINCVI